MASSARNKAIVAAMLLLVAIGMLAYRLYPPVAQWWSAPPEDKIELQMQQLQGLNPAARHPPSLSSPREEADRALFLRVVSERPADVLVLPFSPTQAVSLDRTARALMTYRLANAIAARSDLKVADPGMVMRALGVRRRNYDPEEARKLAAALKVKWVISAVVTRPVAAKPEDTPLVFSLSIACSPAGGSSSAPAIDVKDIAFADDFPPEEAFRAVLDSVVEQLPLGPFKPKAEPIAAEPLSGTLPLNPFVLVNETTKSPLERALRLQLLAAFHPGHGPQRETLYERSIIALDPLSPDSPDYRVLRARAYHHLGRRPYALIVLEGETGAASPAHAALRAFLDGNLPALEKAATGTPQAAFRLMSRFEAEHVRADYVRQSGYQERRQAILDQWPRYELLVRLRLSVEDWSNPEIPFLIEQQLNALKVPVSLPGERVANVIEALLERMLPVRPTSEYNLGPAAAIEECLDSFWRSDAARLIGEGLGPRPMAFDYFELLQEINRAAALKGVRLICCMQGRPVPGRIAMEQLRSIVPVDAQMANTDAGITYQLVRQQAQPNWASREAEAGSRLARDAYLWEGGETLEARLAEELVWRKTLIKYMDEPVSRQRKWLEEPRNRMTPGEHPQELSLRRHLRSLAFTDSHARLLSYIEEDLTALGRRLEFDAIYQQNSHRFDGSRARVDILAAIAHRSGDVATEERLRLEAVAAAPDEWTGYWSLGWLYLDRKDLNAVQKTFLSFPPFHQESDHPVELGNHASQAANLLVNAGDLDQARPLLQLCAELRTGSNAQMGCEERLAVMSGDYQAATALARQNLERYQAIDSARRYIQYLFLRGQSDAGWKAVDQWSARFLGDEMQDAIAIGHGIAGHSDQEIIDIAARWRGREDGTGRENWLRDERMFMALFPDRDASEQTLALFKSAVLGGARLFYVDLAAGHLAFERRDYNAALESWRSVDAHLTNDSAKLGGGRHFLVSYLAAASALAGHPDASAERLAAYRQHFPDAVETILTNAVLEGLKGQSESAKAEFWRAFLRASSQAWHPTETTQLAILELIEVVLENTHDAGYRDLILEFAERIERIEPRGYAFAFEAKYAKSKEQQIRALAYAMYLDRKSLRIRHFTERQREEALAWWAKELPYTHSN